MMSMLVILLLQLRPAHSQKVGIARSQTVVYPVRLNLLMLRSQRPLAQRHAHSQVVEIARNQTVVFPVRLNHLKLRN